ncbi:hypothetical protein D9M71_271940 [compost metagenome]
MTGIAKTDLAAFCPIPTQQTIKQGLKSGRYVLTDLGLERRCSKCNDTWPADTEFFWSAPSTGAGLHCWCKACYLAWKTPTRKAA